VEGSSTTIFEGAVRTDAKTLFKDPTHPSVSHPCDGTNGGANPTPGPTMTGALDDGSIAGGFTWAGTWFGGFPDFGIDRIGPDAATSSVFWGYALNYTLAPVGGCQQRVVAGDQVLFGYDYFNKAHLLKLTGPGSVDVNQPVTMAVVNGDDGTPAAGASVGGQLTGPSGTATLTFDTTGVHHLKAERSDSLRSNALDVCVHLGNDGTCGTEVQASGLGPAPAPQVVPVVDRDGPGAHIAGLRLGQRFARRRAPRLLSGTVDSDPLGLKAVYIRMWRHYHGHCWFYGWRTERLDPNVCGSHRDLVFAGERPSWSYLIPFTLPPGHYRVDAIAVDGAGNGSAIVLGLNRVDFYVR
jgi:hypothetical protein